MSDFPSHLHSWVTTGTIPWGPIQEDMMIRVANTILFSNSDEGLRWNHFFKSID